MLVLFRNPEQADWLRADPSLLPSAVEEILRYAGPVHTTRRVARTDVSINGAEIQSGDVVITLLAAANRDPAKYPDPDRFDIARNPTDHLAFGDGIHFCLGASLARLEGQIAIGTLIKRLPNLRLVGEPEWAGTPGGQMADVAIRGITSLRVAPRV
jgi:cytochrome P450